MGYTHYWTFKATKRVKGSAERAEKNYIKALKACNVIIAYWQGQNPKGGDSDECRLSGYSAHVSQNKYGGLHINGKGDMSHEDFCLREHFNQNEDFNFCKTARKPYDTVVVACLIVLKYYLGDLINVSSDGGSDDWQAGLDLIKNAIDLDLKNPIKKRA